MQHKKLLWLYYNEVFTFGNLKHQELPTMFSDFEKERTETLNEYVCVNKAHSFYAMPVLSMKFEVCECSKAAPVGKHIELCRPIMSTSF